jgi:hypothetical protein
MSTPLDRHAEPYAINFSASPLEDLHGVGSEAGVALQGCEENEAQRFTQLDDRSKVIRLDAVISPSEITSAKQSKKRQI